MTCNTLYKYTLTSLIVEKVHATRKIIIFIQSKLTRAISQYKT